MSILSDAVERASIALTEVIFEYEGRRILVAFRKSCDEIIGYFKFVEENRNMLVAGPEIYRVVTAKAEDGKENLLEHLKAVLAV